MVYARLASGYRPGGPNQAIPGLPSHYEPDKTRNYEVGFKGDVLDHRLSFDASLYYIEWTNIQLQLLDPATSQDYYANGGRAKSQGVELSVETRPLTGLTISGWVTWDDAQLTQNLPASSTAVGSAGDTLPYSSRFSGTLSMEEQFPLAPNLSGFVGGAVNYVGARQGVFAAYYDVPPERQLFPAYAKTDLRGGLHYDSWTLNLFVNNVTDRRGLLYGGLGSFDPSAFYYIQPRTVGVSMVKTF
jgi:iron complex outermembrane recepter protein